MTAAELVLPTEPPSGITSPLLIMATATTSPAQIHALAIAFRYIADQHIEIFSSLENGDELARWTMLKQECENVIGGITLF